jgi:2-iminobutanoate/2-iminopropanoate deaminase
LSHHREPVTAMNAPAAVGPYSHAVRSGNLLFCSGQIPLDPESGELVGSTAGEQATQCMENLRSVCVAAGADLADVVKTTIFVTSMGDFAEVNDAYGEHFSAEPPARSTVEVSALPKNARVEIEAIVALPDSA